MSAEAKKDLACHSWELASQCAPDLLEEVYAVDSVWHEPDQDVHGLEEAKQYYSTCLSAFPDLSFTVEDVIAEGDKVVVRWTVRGTHEGETEAFGSPTGSQLEQEGITIHRIEEDKIVEEWERYDFLSFLQQLELIPDQ